MFLIVSLLYNIIVTWSRKGKRIACGTISGEILFYTTTGELKKKIKRPEKLKEGKVQFIQWVEDVSFFVIYVSPTNETTCFQILDDKETVCLKLLF